MTDQQSAKMMSCTGNQWLKTPAMDYLAANGVRFERKDKELELRDMQKDPHEKTHCTADPGRATDLETMKQVFEYGLSVGSGSP